MTKEASAGPSWRNIPRQRLAIYRKIKFEPFSDTTPLSIAAIKDELKQAAERGYHQSSSEYIADLAGVALPLAVRHCRLSLVVAGPTSRCLARRPETAATIQAILQRYVPELDRG